MAKSSQDHPTWRCGVVTALAAVTALTAAACSSDSSSSGGTTTAAAPVTTTAAGTTTATTASAASTCVADVDRVIGTQSTAASTTASLPADLVAKLDEAAQAGFKLAAAPGAIVGVRTPQGTWIKAYGESDPTTNAPMTADMHTRIGSVTKTFTGTMIMQLAEQKKISLDDTIDKYLTGIPNGDRVTLRMLANMTSGIASYTRSTKFTDVFFSQPETVWTPDQLVAIGVGESPLFEPGAQFDYSNTNTVLLGKVIEKVTGQPIGTAIKQMIFDPLHLNDTVWPGDSTDLPAPYPQGYTLQGNAATPSNPSNATNWNPSWGWTAGELISNMNDLLTYDRALGTGQGLLSPASQAERLRSFPGEAGYGIGLGCIDGWVGHTGELPGYNTSVYYDTTSDTSIVVQTNSDIASGACPESATLTDDPGEAVCRAPATRIFATVSVATGQRIHAAPAEVAAPYRRADTLGAVPPWMPPWDTDRDRYRMSFDDDAEAYERSRPLAAAAVSGRMTISIGIAWSCRLIYEDAGCNARPMDDPETGAFHRQEVTSAGPDGDPAPGRMQLDSHGHSEEPDNDRALEVATGRRRAAGRLRDDDRQGPPLRRRGGHRFGSRLRCRLRHERPRCDKCARGGHGNPVSRGPSQRSGRRRHSCRHVSRWRSRRRQATCRSAGHSVAAG